MLFLLTDKASVGTAAGLAVVDAVEVDLLRAYL